MNFPFDLFFLDAGRLDGRIVATGLPTPSVAPSDPTETPLPSSSPEPPDSVEPTPQPGVSTIEGGGLGLHWTASATVENGKACMYLTIDEGPTSAQACGDASAPVLGVDAVDGGIILFGVLPELVTVDWKLEETGVSSTLMMVASGEHDAGFPFAIAIPEAAIPNDHGQLVVRFLGADDTVAYPEWRTDLPG
jgi:hypothetical protein